MMAASADVDAAIVAALQGDAALAALLPHGVYIDEAPGGSTQFAIVSLIEETDEDTFDGRGFEDALYLVVARELSTARPMNIRAAEARIDAILARGSFSAPGYAAITTTRESRVRLTEVDATDASLRWAHRGGRYRVMASLG